MNRRTDVFDAWILSSRKRARRMTRDERKSFLIGVMVIAAADGRHWGTMYDIARWSGMSPSSHLMRYLRELVNEGRASAYEDEYRVGITRTFFSVTQNTEQKSYFEKIDKGMFDE